MNALIMLVLALAVATDANPDRVIGGSETSISKYPFAVAMLFSRTGSGVFRQSCAGSIINNRAVLSVAHCYEWNKNPNQWRMRVGSTSSESGGDVYNTNLIVNHPDYNRITIDNDIAILKINGVFSFNNNVRAGVIPCPTYKLADGAPLTVIGWGLTSPKGFAAEKLHHVQVSVINKDICKQRYSGIKLTVTENMVCSGVLDIGGRDSCDGDSGGAVLHRNVIVGITSWGRKCADPYYPGVNVLVSNYMSWILKNR